MLCVVAPVLQVLPVNDEDVSTTLPPWQNVVGPLALIVGVTAGVTVTAVTAETFVQLFALVTVTV